MRSKLHYFGASEEEYFHRVADRRTQLLRPLAMFFVRRNVRADALTLASFLLLPFFFFPLFGLRHYVAAWLVLLLHIAIDGLDGPVARLGRYASDKGALSDIVNDITAMVIVALTAIHFGFAPALLGGTYMVTYLYMIVFVIARNVTNMPYTFVFKSKYYLMLFLLVKVHWRVDILNPFLLVMSVYQAAVTAVGFFHLRNRLTGMLGAASRGAWPSPDKVQRRQQRAARRAARIAKIRQGFDRFRGRA